MHARLRRRLATALRGVVADVVGPLSQPAGGHVDVAVFPGEWHIVCIATTGRIRTGRGRAVLRAFDPAASWVSPLGQVPADCRRALRLLVRPGTRRPVRRHGLVEVGVRWLCENLQRSRDPDDVWLTLAALDTAADGWLPFPGCAVDAVSALQHPSARPPRHVRSLLRRRALPPVWAWHSVRQQDDGTWQLTSAEGPHVLQVTADGRTAVLLDLGQVPDVDRSLTVSFTSALLHDLQLAVASLPQHSVRVRRRSRLLHVHPSWPARGEDGPGVVGTVEVSAGLRRRRLHLAVKGDLPTAAAVDLPQLRMVLGQAVADAAGCAEGRLAGQAFLAGWNRLNPSIDVTIGGRSLALRGHDEDLDGVRLPSLAERFLRVAAEGLPAMTVTGTAARDLLNHQAVPAVVHALESLMQPVSGQEATRRTLVTLQALLGTQLRQGQEYAAALDLPWAADRRRHMLTRSDASRSAARAAELACEVAIRMHDRAGRGADRIDARLWTCCATVVLELGLRSQASHVGLTELTVTCNSDGGLSASVVSSGQVEERTYLRLRELHERERARSAPETAEPDLEEAGDVRYQAISDGDPDGLLEAAERALHAAAGTTLGPIFAVLRSGSDLAAGGTGGLPYGGPGEGIALLDPTTFLDDVATWSGEPMDQLEAALRLLTLDGEALRSGVLDFWRLERRQRRLATRPFVSTADGIIVTPARVHATQLLVAGYLQDGRLPWPDPGPLWDAARGEYARLRQRGDRKLEHDVAASLQQAGLAVRSQVRPLAKGLAWLPGEVDVLAADPKRRRLWVVEVKNPHRSFSAAEMSDEVGAIHGTRWAGGGGRNRRDQAAVLLSKAEACRSRLLDCLTYLGVSDAAVDDWTTHPVIVTPGVCAASVFAEPLVLFAVTDQLPDLVDLDVLPPAGLLLQLPEVAPGFGSGDGERC